MRYRLLSSIIALVLFALAAPAQSPPPNAKPVPKKARYTPPRTRDGQPDLGGVWLSNGATPLERPKELAGKPFLTEAEVAELKTRAERLFKSGNSDFAAGDNAFLAAWAGVEQYKNPAKSVGGSDEMVERVFDNRTSLISDPPDGRIPPLTPEAQRRQQEAAAQPPAAGVQDLSNALRCITYGVPRLGGNFGSGPYSYYQIFQTRDYVVLFLEVAHEARIIPLDGRPHLPTDIRQWSGDSRGRWEGDTLVVDTSNFSRQSNFMGSRENLHLVERLTRVSADTIQYEMTIEDPTVWTRPWTAMIRLRRTPEPIFEWACHEGNYEQIVGILGAARADERAAAEAAAKKK